MSVGIQLHLLSSSQSLLPSPCRFTILQSSVAPTSVEYYYTSFVTMYDDQKGILKFLVDRFVFLGGGAMGGFVRIGGWFLPANPRHQAGDKTPRVCD